MLIASTCAAGDRGPGSLALLNAPTHAGSDGAGGILITGAPLRMPPKYATLNLAALKNSADNLNRVIRRLFPNGTITTVAGVAGLTAFNGDMIPATTANLGNPFSTLPNPGGNGFLISDAGNNRIRQVFRNGTITTVAGEHREPVLYSVGCCCVLQLAPSFVSFSGTGTAGSTGNGGPAVQSLLSGPRGLAPDGAGGFFFSDTTNAGTCLVCLFLSPDQIPH